MELMTEDEHAAMALTAELAEVLGRIVGHSTTRQFDMGEVITPLHTIQRHILSNAAARAYPGKYRRLGVHIESKDCDSVDCPDYVEGESHQRYSGGCKGE